MEGVGVCKVVKEEVKVGEGEGVVVTVEVPQLVREEAGEEEGVKVNPSEAKELQVELTLPLEKREAAEEVLGVEVEVEQGVARGVVEGVVEREESGGEGVLRGVEDPLLVAPYVSVMVEVTVRVGMGVGDTLGLPVTLPVGECVRDGVGERVTRLGVGV